MIFNSIIIVGEKSNSGNIAYKSYVTNYKELFNNIT